jgi:hypothetical protein
VYGYARNPNVHWSLVVGNWDWLEPWAFRISKKIVGVVYPISLSMIFLVFTIIIRRFPFFKKKPSPRDFDCVILPPMIIGLIYWFFTAPDPRFAHALFWLLSLSSALLLLASVQPLLDKRSFAAVMTVVFVILNFYFISITLKNLDNFKEVSFTGWYPIKTVPLIKKETSSGLVVYTPVEGDQYPFNAIL